MAFYLLKLNFFTAEPAPKGEKINGEIFFYNYAFIIYVNFVKLYGFTF